MLQEGADVALVGIGTGVGIACEAAALLAAEGITPTVVDARFVKPLDTELLERLAATHGGSSPSRRTRSPAASAAPSSKRVGSTVEVVRFGLPDAFVPHGDRARVLADVGLTPQAVALAARAHSPALTRVK